MTAGQIPSEHKKNRTHAYAVELEWTGDLGSGTASYTTYSRSHQVAAADKAALLLSSDPLFRGDRDR